MKPKLKLVYGGTIARVRPNGTRPIHQIAVDVLGAWPTINPAAMSYLQAMFSIERIEDCFGLDTAESIVLRFLAAAQHFRGPTAKKLKSELRDILSKIDREIADANHRAAYE